MKKVIFTTVVLYILIQFSLPKANAGCRPINGDTGVCDTGGDCSVVKPGLTGICCDNVQVECITVTPSDYNYETHDSTGTGTCLPGSPTCLPRTTTNSAPGSSFNPFCNGTSGVQTAIGCISTDPADFIGTFLKFGVGIAGGIAFLLILFGGFQIITSAGNPEQLNAGKELISSAIAGLLLIIFSILLLKIIGYNILGIPDFGD